MERNIYSTNFLKWFSDERPYLFEKIIKYQDVTNNIPSNSKVSSSLEISILKKISRYKPLANYITTSGKIIYYHNAPVHWGKVFDFIPNYFVAGKQQQSSHLKSLLFADEFGSSIGICLLNSSFFYWYNWQYSNCRDLSQKDVLRAPISIEKMDQVKKKEFVSLKNKLMKDFRKNSKVYKRVSNNVESQFDAFYPMYSKDIIDEIDEFLGVHFDLNDNEIDFIKNYDLKYRLGKQFENDEDE